MSAVAAVRGAGSGVEAVAAPLLTRRQSVRSVEQDAVEELARCARELPVVVVRGKARKTVGPRGKPTAR